MIAELVVHDLGVFADARLVLAPGFTALTGETGAGKSLVVGAIQLLLGARADASVVRPGCVEATIDGRFVAADGTETILSRVVPAEGRSRAYVNGRPVTASELAETGAGLVELHGQHAHQKLLRPAEQRTALDRFAGVDLTALHEARAAVRAIERALTELGGDERTRARELDLLRYQLDELESAQLDDPDEDAALDAEEDLLADAVSHREVAERTAGALVGDDGLHDQLQSTLGALSGRGPFDDVMGRLQAAAAEISEAAHDIRAIAEGIADDPERLDVIRRRRQLLAELRRKYGETLEEVIAERDRVRARLDELESHDERAAELERERTAATTAERAAAAVVAKARRAGAPALAGGVQERLRELAMPDAVLRVDVAGEDPADDVNFLLAANPGSDPQPMTKVASGGELSRATLALRLELTAGPPSLVFDEVDAGIGGEAAWAVARSLRALADRHQILVVTHLPQVAAFAQQQISVSKRSSGGTTEAMTVQLDDDARVEEIARMLSGQPGSDVGREHAVELLAEAAGRTV